MRWSVLVVIAAVLLTGCRQFSEQDQATLRKIDQGVAEWRRGETDEVMRREAAKGDIALQRSLVLLDVELAKVRRAEAVRLSRYLPSDVADCRSRGNAAFGDVALKTMVMNDCLSASELRRAGR